MTSPASRKTLFISALSAASTDKGEALKEGEGQRYRVDSEDFRAIPNAPFAYWLTSGLRDVFKKFPKLGEQADAVVGLQTSDDFRFLRLWWEVEAKKLGFNAEDTLNGRGWVHIAKEGNYGKFYSDIYLTLNWSENGNVIKSWAGTLYNNSHWSRIIKNVEHYFVPGLTWTRRTTKNISFRIIPSGSIFADKGPAVLFKDENTNYRLIVLLNSNIFSRLVGVTIGAASAAARSYEAGIISSIPIPSSDPFNLQLIAQSAFGLIRSKDTAAETSHAFRVPWLLQFSADTLVERFMDYQTFMNQTEADLARMHTEIDELAFDLYELSEEDCALIRAGVGAASAQPTDEDGLDADASSDAATTDDGEDGEEEEAAGADLATLSHALLSWCVGAAFGRWDVRMALDQTLIPELQGPFERLPVVAPAGLVGVDGYPAQGGQVAPLDWLRARPNVISLPEGEWHNTSEYPLNVAWDGILVSDNGNPRDLAGRVRAVLALLFAERAEAAEDALLSAIRGTSRRPADLEEYLGGPKFFFASHLKGHSRSRRKAPVYWPLMHPDTPNFVVWLYAPAMTAQTLPRVLTDVVLPRLDIAKAEVDRLQGERAASDNAKTARALEQAEDTARGLTALAAELRRVGGCQVRALAGRRRPTERRATARCVSLERSGPRLPRHSGGQVPLEPRPQAVD